MEGLRLAFKENGSWILLPYCSLVIPSSNVKGSITEDASQDRRQKKYQMYDSFGERNK
jgi:hypothetical protein